MRSLLTVTAAALALDHAVAISRFLASKKDLRVTSSFPNGFDANAKYPGESAHGGGSADKEPDGFSKKTIELLANYRRVTRQYETDAEEAEKAAVLYDKMSRSAMPVSKAVTADLTAKEFHHDKLDIWAHAAWQFEQMLTDPRPGKAAVAAAKATAPYAKAYAAYTAAENAYGGIAAGYGLRVGADSAKAKQLQTYANQYRLQGNKLMADSYQSQADSLMKQAEAFKGIAEDYNAMAAKIFGVLPGIQAAAGAAGGRAAGLINPGVTPPEGLVPFTPVPPLEFVQVQAKSEPARSGMATSKEGRPM